MNDFFKAIVFGGIFALPFLVLYVENDFFFPFITGKNFAFRIIVETVFAAWILLALYEPKYRPKFSWILAGFASLLIVMFFANLFGEYPQKSFWSNFERMDGYITLLHVFMYMVVAGSVMTTEKLWSYFLHTTVAVALLVAIYGLAQHAGMIEGGRARIDSRLGNAAYMAVYMLFHIFFLFFLFVRSKVTSHRVIYALIVIIFIYTLLLTGTRGTFLGLFGGTTLTVLYAVIFGRRYPQMRRYAIGGLVALLVVVGLFYGAKQTEFVQNSPSLTRIASIDLSRDLEVRSVIWGMALEGVKERPLLGWGQGNFSYVFNKNYDPYLWHAEAWFDRVHNIFLDWLIAGGVLGLLAYLSIFVAALYYLLWQPLFRKDDTQPTFTLLERSVLFGLLAGYFAHNLVVFDNIISYIFFGTLLALLHARVSEPFAAIAEKPIDERLINQFATPIVILLFGATVYFVHAPGIGAAGDIIDALQQSTVDARLQEFRQAIDRNSFADQEIVEQFAQNAISIARNPNIAPEQKQNFIQEAELALMDMINEKPGDARLHIFFATFYRSVGQYDKAQEQAAFARTFSPEKQAIIVEQGVIELTLNNLEAARDFFKDAFELDETFTQGRILYASALFATGDVETAKALITDEYMKEFALNDYALSTVNNAGNQQEFLMKLFEARIGAQPGNAQNHASLAFLKYDTGDIPGAIEVLEAAATAVPDFAPRAQCFIENLNTGNKPDEGC